MKNALKAKLDAGKSVFGSWIMTSGLDTAEIMARAGADCLMIDGEHGAMDMETAGRMVSLIRPTPTVPLLRIPGYDRLLVKRGLDTGAGGLMVPMVNTRSQAEQVVRACKYPPEGVRGMGFGRAVLFGSGGGDPDYYATANREVMVIVQIEHVEAVENVEEIVSVPGVDIAFVGPGDLSHSMGLPGQMNHPDVQAACRKVIEACQRHNVVPGIYTWSGAIGQHLDMGFRFLLGGTDSIFLYTGVRKLADEFASLAGS